MPNAVELVVKKVMVNRLSILILLISVTIISCRTAAPTAAQRQASFIYENDVAEQQKFIACFKTIRTNPDYQKLYEHQWDGASYSPALEQLTDSNLPSDEDVKLIIAVHNEMAHCRGQAIEGYSRFLPGFIPILVEFYQASDLLVVDQIQKKITWGEANKRRMENKNAFIAKAQTFTTQLKRDLDASHNAELAHREAAIALSDWSYQQQRLLRQNQEIINSINRPVTTNCFRYGNMVQCNSN